MEYHLAEGWMAPDLDALISLLHLFLIVLRQHPPFAQVAQVFPFVVPQAWFDMMVRMLLFQYGQCHE